MFIIESNPVVHRQLIIKSAIAFILQMMLIVLLMRSQLGDISSGVYQGDIQVNFSRIICAFLLHIFVVPEIKTSMSMMMYATQNPKRFECSTNFYPFMLALMKGVAGILTEVVNIYIIVKSTTTYDILYDFVALKIIIEIDDMMAKTLLGENVDVEDIID